MANFADFAMKSTPTPQAPQLHETYFGNCPRDESGHCLPKDQADRAGRGKPALPDDWDYPMPPIKPVPGPPQSESVRLPPPKPIAKNDDALDLGKDDNDLDLGDSEYDVDLDMDGDWFGDVDINQFNKDSFQETAIAAWTSIDQRGEPQSNYISVVTGGYAVPPEVRQERGGPSHIELSRWVSRGPDGVIEEAGDWTENRDQAEEEGLEYAESMDEGDDYIAQKRDDEEDGEEENDIDDEDDDYATTLNKLLQKLDELGEDDSKPPEEFLKKESKLKPKKSAAGVTSELDIDEMDEKIARQLFNRPDADIEDVWDALASVVGAPDDATVNVVHIGKYQKLYSDDKLVDAEGIRVKIEHPHFDSATRFIGITSDGKRFIRNEILELSPDAPKGSGLNLFLTQVANAAAEGFEHIETHAAGNYEGQMNGYYTWPRYGYDVSLKEAVEHKPKLVKKILDKVPTARCLRDVMAAKQVNLSEQEEREVRQRLRVVDNNTGIKKDRPIITGADWWQAMGEDLHLRFDLSQASWSRVLLETYLEKKQAGKGTKALTSYHIKARTTLKKAGKNNDRRGDQIDYDADDDEALRRAWEELFPSQQEEKPKDDSKALSSVDELSGGALIPPAKQGRKIKPKWNQTSLGDHPDFYTEVKAFPSWLAKATTAQIGVPFQGPSGRWFVRRQLDGRVVPAKNPNALPKPTRTPRTPKPKPPVVPTSSTKPTDAPKPPKVKTPTPRQHARQIGTQEVAKIEAKLKAGQPLTAQELTDFPLYLTRLTISELKKLQASLGSWKFVSNSLKQAKIDMLVQWAKLHNPIAASTASTPTTPTPASTATPTTPTPAPTTTPTPAASPASPPKLLSVDTDRIELEELIDAKIVKLGLSPQEAIDQDASGKILKALHGKHDGSLDTWEINRLLKSLKVQQATTLLKPHYSNGAKQGPNPMMPDESRPADLTPDEQVAIQVYTGTAYRGLNTTMRATGKPPAKFQKLHDDLQAAFAKVKPFAKPVDLVRSMNIDDPVKMQTFLSQMQTAQNTNNPVVLGGYLSTSTQQVYSSSWPRNIVMNIKAVHGLDMRPLSHCPQADEVVLNHTSEFSVKAVRKVGSDWHVDLEQLAPGAKASPTSTPTTTSASASTAHTPTPKPAPATKPQTTFKSPEHSQAVTDYLYNKVNHTLHTDKFGGHQDAMLEKILEESGRAEKPALVDTASIDALKQKGWKVFYRGVGSQQYVDQFRNGSLYCGSGIFGNGTYVMQAIDKTDPDEQFALQEAKSYGNHVMRMALPPTAKVVDGIQLAMDIKAYTKDLKAKLKAKTIDAATYKKLSDVCIDPGRFAALHNYDAIDADGAGYYVILNRSILAVESKDY